MSTRAARATGPTRTEKLLRRFGTMLLPSVAILVAVAAIGPAGFGGAGGLAMLPAPEPADSPAAGSASVVPETDSDIARRRMPDAHDPLSGADGQAELPPEATAAEPPEARQARALVFSLRVAADSSTPQFPQLEVDEASRLLNRHPEVAAVFTAALPGASRTFRTFLLHTFYRVQDDVLREHLLAQHQETDPVEARMREILSSRERILEVLTGHTDADLLSDLLGRMGSPLLEDRDIRLALLDLVANSGDPKIRDRALGRIGKYDDPEIRRLLLATLSDPLRDLSERQTAARALTRRPGPDTRVAFVDILNRNEAAPLLRFAALGLEHDAADPEVSEVLLDLLLSEPADVTARKNAATALGYAVRTSGEAGPLALENRLRSALTDLAQQQNSGPVLVHAMGEVSRGLEGRFDDDLVGILRAHPEEELRVLLVADPSLHRFLEEL